MGMRISTNVASISAQRFLARSEARALHASRALASGNRIVNAGDDAAGFAISEGLRAQGRSLGQAKKNADNAVGFIQVAEGGLNEQHNIAIRLRELAVQSASDTVGSEEREYLNTEFQQLVQEFDRIAKTTTYGNKSLLIGEEKQYRFHLGTGGTVDDSISYTLDADTRAETVGLEGLEITDADDSRDVLDDIDAVQNKIASARANFGAIQSRLQIASNNLDLQRENIEAARSRITDADVAFEVSEMVQGNVQQEMGIAVLAQANMGPQRALKLLG